MKDGPGKETNEDDLEKRVRRFDRRVLQDYLVPIVVSLFTTLILLAIFFSAKH